MTDLPLISIVITTHNRVHYVLEAIESAIRQSYPNKEIIVVDDGSTDNTSAAIQTAYQNITYIFQPNQGCAAAHNTGLAQAHGTYIAFLDSDDIWDRDFLQNLYQGMQRYHLDIAFANWTYSPDRSHPFLQAHADIAPFTQKQQEDSWVLLTQEEQEDIFLKGCPSPTSSLLFRADKNYLYAEKDILVAPDWNMMFANIFRQKSKIGFTFAILWQKNILNDNIYENASRTKLIKDLWINDYWTLYKKYENYLTQKQTAQVKKRIGKFKLMLLKAYFKKGQWITAIKDLSFILSH